MPAFQTPPPCVLIVDDDADTLELSRLLVLEAEPGAKVVTARDAAEAKDYLLGASRSNDESSPLPALILLDVNMPGMDGFGALRWVRGQQWLADIKVVMLSSSDSPADFKRATELGADGYLIKHPNSAVLAFVLNQACRASYTDGAVAQRHDAEIAQNN